jgi:hypothetical protein
MFNAFLKYEKDFREWVEADFPDINPLSRDFLENLRETKEGKRALWPHQMEAVQRAIYSFELLHIKEALLNIVTGGGKTSIIGAVVAWLKYAHGVNKFLLLCPNTIVRDRLEDDFAEAKVFRRALHERTRLARPRTRRSTARHPRQRRGAGKHPAALSNTYHRPAQPRGDHELCERAGGFQR